MTKGKGIERGIRRKLEEKERFDLFLKRAVLDNKSSANE